VREPGRRNVLSHPAVDGFWDVDVVDRECPVIRLIDVGSQDLDIGRDSPRAGLGEGVGGEKLPAGSQGVR
jgi:hypothetical protein